MKRPVQSIELAEIDAAIQDGFKWLRFCSRIERVFEADVNAQRCKTRMKLNIIGLIIHHGFLFSDYRAVPDAFAIDLFVHFGIMTPVTLATNVVLARRPPVWLREGVGVLALVVLAATIAIVASSSGSPMRDLVLFTLILVILFATSMERLRFRYNLAACLVIQGIYSACLATFADVSGDRAIMSNSLVLCVLLFSLLAGYKLEHEERMGYLLRLRDRIRNQQLETLSLRDALTGLWNRRALEAAFTRKPEERGADATHVSAILLFDIDHFKRFNDTNGHQDGDICLKRVAALIAGELTAPGQSVYRFGGEEFLAFLDDTGLDEAVAIAERVRAAVLAAAIPSGTLWREPTDQGCVTLSAGVAAGRIGHGVSPQSLIAAADDALYRAKRNGRNQTLSAEDGSGPDAPVQATLGASGSV